MTRGKVQLKRIQNPVSRRITFSKRKAGLLKKASELALLCDAEVALLIFSPSGNLYEFGSHSINKVLEKYQKCNGSIRHCTSSSDTIEMLRVEVESLQKTMINLKRNYKHMIGEDLGSLSLKELKNLEKKAHLGSRKLRSRKDKILLEYIASSKKKVEEEEDEQGEEGGKKEGKVGGKKMSRKRRKYRRRHKIRSENRSNGMTGLYVFINVAIAPTLGANASYYYV